MHPATDRAICARKKCRKNNTARSATVFARAFHAVHADNRQGDLCLQGAAMVGRFGTWVFGVVLIPGSALAAAPPKAVDPRLVIEMVAREPDIVTPTGVTVDEQGRI